MNKVNYKETTIYTFLGFDILKTTKFYNETNEEDIEDDTPPIQITEDYKKSEFDL